MVYVFGTCELHPQRYALTRAGQTRSLRPKVFQVLLYLLEHRERVVTKDELCTQVWPNQFISEATLESTVRAVRQAIGDSGQGQRLIQTVYSRGYRFVGEVTLHAEAAPPAETTASAVPPVTPRPSQRPAGPAVDMAGLHSPRMMVGRETVLHHLRAALALARQGQRQVVLVTGEAGIGKTTVIEAFAAEVSAEPALWLGRGQCIEQYGTGEAYRPILEALEALCRAAEGERAVALLRQQAPTWLVQLPWRLSDADRARLHYELQGITRERMLREFATVVETLTAERLVVLVLEDLHWSDYATLDLLALLAQHQPVSRLLVLATFRPLDVLVPEHPLRPVVQALQRYGRATELPLALLTLEDVTAYLHARFPGQPWPAALAPWLYHHTDGNPLFLVTMLDTLLARGLCPDAEGPWDVQATLAALAGVPEGLRPLLAQQFARVPPEVQPALEAASVVGIEFSTAAVAAGCGQDLAQVEEACDALARQHLIRPVGMAMWPDGTIATRYAFRHALYHQAAYERLGIGRRAQLHQRIGLRLEEAYGLQAGEMAAALAGHFEAGRDMRRAVHYVRQAGEQAFQRHAYRDALAYLNRGQDLLHTLPATPEREQQGLALQMTLGAVLTVTQGYAAPAVRATYARAHALCQQGAEPQQRFWILLGLQTFYLVRAELQTAWEVGEQLLRLAQDLHEPVCLMEAHHALGNICFWRGELVVASDHLQQSLRFYEPQPHRLQPIHYGSDPKVGCLATLALTLWVLGYPEQALTRMHEAVALAEALAHPFSLAHALNYASGLHIVRQEPALAHARAEAAWALATAQGLPHWQVSGAILHGWTLAEHGQQAAGLAQMHQHIATLRAMGAEVMCPWYLGLVAALYGQAGQATTGLSAVVEALHLVEQHGERCAMAELCRLHGELLLQHDTPDVPRAEACFQQALTLARSQQARSWELRAAMSLARLWQQHGKRAAAQAVLAPVYGWFSEGFDTADLQAAKTLLATLA